MPSEADLPKDLSALARQQALHLHDDQFSSICEVLFREIERALSEMKGVRPVTRAGRIGTPNVVVADLRDLLALGWTVRKIINELLELEYAMSPELTLDFSGTSDQWIPILDAHPETWRVLLNEERRIIANWHFVALGSKDFKRARNGRLLEREISADKVRHIDIPDFYNIYFVAAFIEPQARQLHTLQLFRTSILDHFLYLAKGGVFIDMLCTNAYSPSGEAFCNSFGLPPGKRHSHGGVMYERKLFPLPASLKYSRAEELNALYRRARKSRISPKTKAAK
jgi:hypothetical protein